MLVVIGNVALDTTLRVARLPEAGETVLADAAREGLGGKGSNQAIAAARCGAPVVFVTAVGTDPEGERACRLLADDGIATDTIHRFDAATGRSYIAVSDTGENSIISTRGAPTRLAEAHVDPVLGTLGAGDVLLVQGNLGAAVTGHCLRRARAAGARTIVNPSPIHFAYDDLWPVTDMAVVNAVEVTVLTGTADPVPGGRALRARGVGTVIVTLGARGGVIVGEAVRPFSAPAVNVTDTTGAGDVFCGVLAALTAGRADLATAVRCAADAAALCVTRPGARDAIPTREELAGILARSPTQRTPPLPQSMSPA